jgi:hypothetical protein
MPRRIPPSSAGAAPCWPAVGGGRLKIQPAYFDIASGRVSLV